ncbi:MAG: endonuclease/exonuclease/phosphatase family protein, partial [Alphaproteobacteria bacterium]
YLPRPQSTPQSPAGHVFSLMQVNVFKFNRKHELLLHFIDKYKPDVITIAEATPDWRDALKKLTEEKDGWPYMIDQAKPGSNGMMVLSRHEFSQQESLYPATDTHPALLFRINVNAQDILIASLHPLSPVSKTRFKHRDKYMGGVAASLQQGQDDAVIVAGDMNMTMYAPSYKSFLRQTDLQNTRNGRGLYPTWPVYIPLPTKFKAENLMIPHLLRIPIDHVLYKGNIRPLKFKTLPALGSDHLATLTFFALP